MSIHGTYQRGGRRKRREEQEPVEEEEELGKEKRRECTRNDSKQQWLNIGFHPLHNTIAYYPIG